MIIVGELINMTRKAPREAWKARDAGAIAAMARSQAEAGAQYIDVNSGVPGEEVPCMEWLVDVVLDAVSLPLCIDTTNPQALETALRRVKSPPLINSVSAERERWSNFLPMLKGVPCRVVALLTGDKGLPKSVEDRLENADFLMEKLQGAGFADEDIFLDPCVMPVSTDSQAAAVFLHSLQTLQARWPRTHRIAGLSNVSFGLPARALLNRSFLCLAMGAGLDAAILNPADPQVRQVVSASEALLGQDSYCRRYLQAFRKGLLA
jgi:5-methyltetrahydrofolate corrinoid/iron sulfur protein methyltransferase